MKSVKPPVKHYGTDVTSVSYGEVGEMVHKFGAALRKEGLVAAPERATLERIRTPCSLAIFENTCQEWMIGTFLAAKHNVA